MDDGSSNGLDLLRGETFCEDSIQEQVDSRLQVVWAMLAGLDGDWATKNLSVAHVLGLDDISQLLIGSESVETGLFQELEEDSDDGRPIISLFTVLEVTLDGWIGVW